MLAIHCDIWRDFPYLAFTKMASELEKCTLLERIAPILTVRLYFDASHPENSPLLTLVWWGITFLDLF